MCTLEQVAAHGAGRLAAGAEPLEQARCVERVAASAAPLLCHTQTRPSGNLPNPDKARASSHNNLDTAIIPNLVGQQAGRGVDGSIADDALIDLCDVSVLWLSVMEL